MNLKSMMVSVLSLALMGATPIPLRGDATEPLPIKFTPERARAFCDKWFEALSLKNKPLEQTLDHLMDTFYSSQVVLWDPNFNGPVSGTRAVKEYYRAVLQNYPDWTFQVVQVYPTKQGFVLHYQGSVPGKVESFYGIDILEFDDQARIVKLVEAYDRSLFLDR